jgi:branched-chain amino acid transport system permease protein
VYKDALRRLVTLRGVRATAVGLVGLVALTGLFTATQSSFSMFVYNSWLLAGVGAVALNLLMGTAGQVSIGNAAFLAVGGFSSVWLLSAHVPFPFDVLIGTAAAGVVGLVVGLPALRLRGLHLALATLAAFFIVLFVGDRYQAAKGSSGLGFSIDPLFSGQGLDGAQRVWAWLLTAVLGAVVFAARALMTGKAGRAWRVIRDHEQIAPTLGVEVTRYKLLVFVLSSMAIGLEGGLAAHLAGAVSTDDYTLLLSVQYLSMVLIGGLDSVTGALIGAAVVVALPHFIPTLVSDVVGSSTTTGPQISTIAYGLGVIVFVTGSPEGIVGMARALARRAPARWSPGRPGPQPRPAGGVTPVAPAAPPGEAAEFVGAEEK